MVALALGTPPIAAMVTATTYVIALLIVPALISASAVGALAWVVWVAVVLAAAALAGVVGAAVRADRAAS
jgi:hypothetical protein